MDILSFKISGKFAHFRKFYTTTSPLTFQIPPYTVIKGIIAGILGLEKDSYNESFNNMYIGVEVVSDVTDKKMFGLNFINTQPAPKRQYTQVKQETLIEPEYIIYVGSDNFDYYEQLKEKLENNSWVYTPYLGISEFIANIEHLGEEQNKNLINGENLQIDSIIPEDYFENGKNIDIEEGINFEFEKVPYQMDNERNLLSLKEFLYNPKGCSLTLKNVNYYKFNNKNIILC